MSRLASPEPVQDNQARQNSRFFPRQGHTSFVEILMLFAE